jgi:transcriptional regulator with XRE-family HTH domain
MAPKPLSTYLRTFRKRTCLSQEDVAFLLGSMCGSSVSRHEKGKRIPLLSTLLGYAFILGADVPALYEGAFQDVQTVVRQRAMGLCRSLERKPQTSRRARKIAVLKQLLSEDLTGGANATQG